jgi:hypothetical protein
VIREEQVVRRRVGALMLWAVLPLPFTLIILPPFYLVVGLAALFMLFRPDTPVIFSSLVKNLMGLAIIVVVVLAGGFYVGPLRPLGHLLLLLLAVRGLTVATRRDLVRCLPLLGIVWVVSVASSTHILMFVYLVLSSGVAWWLGMKLLLEKTLRESPSRASVARFPKIRHALIAGCVAFIVGLPVFLVMPRLRSPWVAGPGGVRSVSGFSSAIELARVAEIQESRDVALIVRSGDGTTIDPRWFRLRATAFDLQRTGSWLARGTSSEAPEESNGLVWLGAERDDLRGCVELDVELLRPEQFLFLPYGAVAVEAPVSLVRDTAGGVVLENRYRRSINYKVWVDVEEVRLRDAPIEIDTFVARSDPRIRDLAVEIGGEEIDSAALASRFESYLSTNFDYSLTNAARFSTDPVAWFLFEGRQGHCEFFAGSMVVLLRMLEVPARMVGGYYGGTVTDGGAQIYVRQSNAHAWVEVWLGAERGWVVFDPTPAEGVPGVLGLTGLDRIRWAWDWLQVNWDRWVVGFGLRQQMIIISEIGDFLTAIPRRVNRLHVAWALGLAVAACVVVWGGPRTWKWARLRRRRGRYPAAAELYRVARKLERNGQPVTVGATLRRIAARAQRLWPHAENELEQLVFLAENELYAGAVIGNEHRTQVRQARIELRQAVRRTETKPV